MTLASAAGFVEALRALPLLTAGLQTQLAGLQQQFPDVKALAQELIRCGWLTVFQASQVARGKGPELVLDRYVLLDLLGQGGMGAVYRAKQTHMERVVALKVIRPEALKAAGAVERFQREARLAGKLAHVNVVSVFDSGAAGGIHFLVMEHIEGTDLARLIKEKGSLPVRDACYYVLQAALGLQHAFEQGLVHRDIKPANLMLTKAGVIKVMDLGLARTVSSADAAATTGLTRTGVVMGTADYLAPEQALDARKADIRADIYSLGCTLYQLLAGQVPFPGETFTEKLIAHQMQEPEAVETVRLGLPQGLAQVVRTMMAKKPEQRYQTPAEVAQALEPFAETVAPSGAPVLVQAATRPANPAVPLRECPRSVARSRGVLVGVVGCLGLVVVVGAILGVVLGSAALSGLANRVDSAPASARQALAVAATAPRIAGARPEPLDCTGEKGLSEAEVRQAQAAWAQYLGRQVEEPDELAPGVKMTFVLVPPGKFLMGSSKEEAERNPWEKNFDAEAQHEVTITEPFYLGKYPVTQEEYQAVTHANPSYFSAQKAGKQKVAGLDTRRFPVEWVSWKEASDYADTLTKKRSNGLLYRLPTEAEWEYSCRGGRSSSKPFGVGDGRALTSREANFNGYFPYGGAAQGPYLERPCPAGSYDPNALGLRDLHGNVWQWCGDWYGPYPSGKANNPPGSGEGSSRVRRGGCWGYGARHCRAAERYTAGPGVRYYDLGFRLARRSPSGGSK
jgi:formylglycine-generating enzyme required for sulfatase activity/tRNA A-37 threonylcarbamoyl transferase component Bud32